MLDRLPMLFIDYMRYLSRNFPAGGRPPMILVLDISFSSPLHCFLKNILTILLQFAALRENGAPLSCSLHVLLTPDAALSF